VYGARSLCGAVLFVLLGSSTAARPDLVELSVSVSQHGRSVVVTDVVRNRGTGVASASTTGYYLAGRFIGSRAVGRLRTGATSRRTVRLAIPRTMPSGSSRLTACSDTRRRVRESNERNNCRVATRRIVVGDVSAPKFGGLLAATTCIPGPVGGPVRNSPYALRWNAAVDDVTARSEIVYEVYETQVSGTEDFTQPTYVTDPGATTFVTPPLPDDVAHYFVVRARDAAGNVDRNAVERLGMNLCL
jgi:CARDB protein